MNPTQIAQLKIHMASFKGSKAALDHEVLTAYLDGALAGIVLPTGVAGGATNAAPPTPMSPVK